MKPEMLLLFNKNVNVNPTTNCWEWTGARGGHRIRGKQYAVLWFEGQHYRAARLSFEHFVEPLNGLDCLHKCDNTRCVNPEHLFKGNASENAIDMMRKGRQVTAVLTIEKVIEIKTRLQKGERVGVLAKAFGVTGGGHLQHKTRVELETC